jgi:hypothetical protein
MPKATAGTRSGLLIRIGDSVIGVAQVDADAVADLNLNRRAEIKRLPDCASSLTSRRSFTLRAWSTRHGYSIEHHRLTFRGCPGLVARTVPRALGLHLHQLEEPVARQWGHFRVWRSAISMSKIRRTVGLPCWQSGCIAEYGPARGDQVKGILFRHLHDAIQADINVSAREDLDRANPRWRLDDGRSPALAVSVFRVLSGVSVFRPLFGNTRRCSGRERVS